MGEGGLGRVWDHSKLSSNGLEGDGGHLRGMGGSLGLVGRVGSALMVIGWSLVQAGKRKIPGEGGLGRVWDHSKLSSNRLEGDGDHLSVMGCWTGCCCGNSSGFVIVGMSG